MRRFLGALGLLGVLSPQLWAGELGKIPVGVPALGGRPVLVGYLSSQDEYRWYGEETTLIDVTLTLECTLKERKTFFALLYDPQTRKPLGESGHRLILIKYKRFKRMDPKTNEMVEVILDECDQQVFAIEEKTLEAVLLENEKKLRLKRFAVLQTQ